MLTALPPRLLHRLRDAAAAVVALADLGLELLCGEHEHAGGLQRLGGEGRG